MTETKEAVFLVVGDPVRDHIQFFTDEKTHELTKDSMQSSHAKLGLPDNKLKYDAILSIASQHQVSPTADGMSGLVNPVAVGPWRGGKFEAGLWIAMKKAAIRDPKTGRSIFTKHALKDMCERNKLMADANACKLCIFGCFGMQLKWGRVTDGSINELFEVYSDHWFKNPQTNTYEKAISEDQMLLFYTNQPEINRRKLLGLFDKPPPTE